MNTKNSNPRLFGIVLSNRDFKNSETWGKNQFNSSFPASLACYMYSKNLNAKYIAMDENFNSAISEIGVDKVFNTNPLSEDTFYAFETAFTPYQRYYIGSLPRTDLVIQNKEGFCNNALEIKLTALPDNTTCNLNEVKYGSEIVVRPDTIVYLACSILDMYKNNMNQLKQLVQPMNELISDWTHAQNVIPHINIIKNIFKDLVKNKHQEQVSVLLQPIWKTNGKSPELSTQCLDLFVWSNFGLLNLFFPKNTKEICNISRHTRTMIWLFKMLLDASNDGQFDGSKIIDELSYNTKNDKAFATSGVHTQKLMFCQELVSPRIRKDEIKKIILGGGQNLLSPERRFDAILFNSPDLFRG